MKNIDNKNMICWILGALVVGYLLWNIWNNYQESQLESFEGHLDVDHLDACHGLNEEHCNINSNCNFSN